MSRFNFNLENELFTLQEQLVSKEYQPGQYNTFHITEPKPRMISAAPYKDRVIHHALCNVITPILENSMIYDTYANRKGKGTHKAILRFQQFSQHNDYVLQCDIQKFFPSIDHEILKSLIRRKIGCKNTLWLLELIIDNSNPQNSPINYYKNDNLFTPVQRKIGLPIGNLTSQWLGNYFLSPLDHFVKENLGCKYYIRYVDDFVILGNSKKDLWNIKHQIIGFLNDYRLSLHPKKSQIHLIENGTAFLGHRIFRDFRLVKKESVRRFRSRARKKLKLYAAGKISLETFNQSMIGWFAHAAFSDTYRLRGKLIQEIYTEHFDMDIKGKF